MLPGHIPEGRKGGKQRIIDSICDGIWLFSDYLVYNGTVIYKEESW